jgi:hypothetical protein
MSTNTAVEVYLGNSITVASEARFLARLRRGLVEAGVPARILANLHLGADDRQVDFVVITADHVLQVELKVFPGPIVSGPQNGRWTVRVGTGEQEWRDPMWQALQATHALSDALHAFAHTGRVPGPRGRKFYCEIDTIVCAFPALPRGSTFEPHRHVRLLGYDELFETLKESGPSLRWSGEDWDAFGRHLNLYRAEEDSPEALVRQAGVAAVDEYLGRYIQAQGDLPPLVATRVRVGESEAPRPDLLQVLAVGGGVLVHGPSGAGKTLWARAAAVELARAGHVPIWLAAEVCERAFHTSAARSIAPYTSLSPNELLRAADAAGRGVVFMIDDLTKASADVQQVLLTGTQTARVRNATHGLLITAQSAEAAASVPTCVSVELCLPDDAERRAVLDAYGQPDLIDRCGAFTTPLELSLAAACAGELARGASAAELLDLYVDRITGGDERMRAGLRTIARRMHAELVPSLSRPDAARTLRREHGLQDHDLEALLNCRLITVAHGRASFRHERFDHFLAAEALLLAAEDVGVFARALNSPVCTRLRADVIALESQEDRLTTLLAACEDAEVLVAAATGRLGALAERVVDPLLVDALNVACAETVKPGVRFTFEARGGFSGVWRMPDPPSRASAAQWAAVGRLLHRGRFIEGTAKLLGHTDRLCDAAFEESAVRTSALLDQIFAAAYAILPGGLPASTLVHAAVDRPLSRERDTSAPGRTALALLKAEDEPELGVLYLAAHFLQPGDAPSEAADVIVKCLTSDRYHLCLVGLRLAQRSAPHLDGARRQDVLDAINELPPDNLGLNGGIIDALSALGEITPARTLDEVLAEIAEVLAMDDASLQGRMAYGIVSSQFETEALGPYYEAVCELSVADRERLLVLALEGGNAGSWDHWILGEFKDLSSPAVRRAVTAYVARADPERWLSQQEGMAAVIAALRLLVADGASLPEPANRGCADPAWRASLTIIMGELSDAAGTSPDTEAVDGAWTALLSEHRDVFASVLANLHLASIIDDGPSVYERVLSAVPAEGVEVLIWSLEHPEQTRALCGWVYDLPAHIVEWLGRIGDRRAADVLRRFTGDPEVGEAAAAAVRAIEERAIGAAGRSVLAAGQQRPANWPASG